MRRAGIALVFIGSILAALAIVQWRGIALSVDAQGVTLVPGQHAEIRTPFFFCVWETPSQMGCRAAEFKDEYGQSFYKADALPGCGEWVVAPGTKPGLLLTPGGTNCPGFSISFGVLYWFSTPPIMVTPSPTFTPFTATVTPPLDWATATPSPAVTAGVTVTPTPSPPGGTPTPTRSVTGTPKILYGNMCEPDPTPVYPHSITIYGQGGLTSPAFYWWCQVNVTPDLVIVVPRATFEASYDNGPRQLLIDLGR